MKIKIVTIQYLIVLIWMIVLSFFVFYYQHQNNSLWNNQIDINMMNNERWDSQIQSNQGLIGFYTNQVEVNKAFMRILASAFNVTFNQSLDEAAISG
jgi:hypothetical protein